MRTPDEITINGKKLSEIIKLHREWSNGNEGERADLRGADLRWADLSWADLSWADLHGADLCEAALRGAVVRPGWSVPGWREQDGRATAVAS